MNNGVISTGAKRKRAKWRDPFFWQLAALTVLLSNAVVYAQISTHTADQRQLRDPWFRHGRTIPGQAAAALRYRAHLQKMQMRAAQAKARQEEPSSRARGITITVPWMPLGPAPLQSDATGLGEQDYNWVSGRATAIAADPADATGNTVYLGGAYGGVWKSTNAGPASHSPASVVWTTVADDQATLAVGSIAIQPGNNNPAQSVVLVGTGETDSSADSYYGLGILRSADAGNSWTLISEDTTKSRSFAGLGFSKIAFSTSAPTLAIAAAAATSEGILEGLENPVMVNRGLYYSIDSGQNWTYTDVTDGAGAISPDSATTVVYNAAAGTFFAALRYHGFYASSDGINWTRLLNQPGFGLTTVACPSQAVSPSFCPIYRAEIAVVPGRNEMYVWYVDVNDIDQGIWESTDGGITWMQLDETGIIDCGDLFGGCGTDQGTYNLALAAVPNGQATDLYAGAVNLYKCTVSGVFPTCNPNVSPPPPPSATFLNLTHVYGCPPDFGSIAHVHPSQHAMAFMLLNNNTQDLMYFANDGGLYRTLDGFTDLLSGTCGQTNLFDSLNQTLGSMTQFVAFAQSPTDPNTLLGGSQGNGSPATASAEGSTSWLNVNSADGGYSIINPRNELEWFTENTGVSIQKCESGITCHAQDFSDGLIVSNATLGGDAGPLFTPYILDPQDTSELVVGTCRVWRGTTNGTGFIAVSGNFDNGGTCTGNEVNQIRALAAGGPVDPNGFSYVIYAGTDGQGPNSNSSPTGGHILVTTNADSGPNFWMNQTGSINPGNFPVSSIALDTSDSQGDTAYITIMGFGVSHVFQTTNAGTSWTDFTGDLPDAPVNAIILDQSSRTLYVGTDVGVFSSSTTSPNWTEVGTASGSGQSPGFLPNVAVTGLGIFNSDGEKKIRASTYGRGIWEYDLVSTPDFELTVSKNPMIVFAGQQSVFQATIMALNGYSGMVNLSCTAGASTPPSTCTVFPLSVDPSALGSKVSVTVSGAPGTYNFNLQGTDQNNLTHRLALTLQSVSFSLLPPSPPSLTLGAPATSVAVALQVSGMGPFIDAVNLSCAPPLPAGVACNFQPSSVNPESGTAQSNLFVSTSPTTQMGTYTLSINAAANPDIPDAPAISQPLLLTVTPDFSLTLNNTSATAPENNPATFTGMVSTIDGYASAINLTCGTGAPPMCTPNPSSVQASMQGTPFSVTVESNAVANYDFTIIAAGTSPAITHSLPVIFASTNANAGPDYAIAIANPSLSAPVNAQAQYNGTLTALDGYNSPVNLTCGANSPPSCTAMPLTLTPTASGAPFTVTVLSKMAGSYDFSILAQGTDHAQTMHTANAIFQANDVTLFLQQQYWRANRKSRAIGDLQPGYFSHGWHAFQCGDIFLCRVARKKFVRVQSGNHRRRQWQRRRDLDRRYYFGNAERRLNHHGRRHIGFQHGQRQPVAHANCDGHRPEHLSVHHQYQHRTSNHCGRTDRDLHI